MTILLEPGLVIVKVPFAVRRRGGRKAVIAPPGGSVARAEPSEALIKSLVKAHRWRKLLEAGEFSTIAELSTTEKINHSYLCRVMRLTLLAPDIVQSILDGTQHPALQLQHFLKPFPLRWDEQRIFFESEARDAEL